jgi:hypothetical protein
MSARAKLDRMQHPDNERQLRAEQALALYETIEAIATNQEDPRWRQAALLIRQLRDFGPEPDPGVPSPFVAGGGFGHRTGGSAALASDRLYDGYAE